VIRTDILIIGGGFSGVIMALEARRHGFEDIVILEKASDLGGTWRENAYPGVACDIPCHLYTLADHPKPNWRRRYAAGVDIWDYLREVARSEHLYPVARFERKFTGAAWDAETRLWRVETAEGKVFQSRVLVSAMGPLHQPRIPDLPGLDTFKGTCFHSAEWDPETQISSRDVAVIGTGASAAQLVPHVARDAARLTVYQRTAPWVLPLFNGAIPRWLRRLYGRWPWLMRLDRALTFWLQEMTHRVFRGDPTAVSLARRIARRHMRCGLRDPALQKRLTPDYQIGCKRILLSNDWYPALKRSNVEVVTGPIKSVEADKIIGTDGIARPVEVLILATGFDATGALAHLPFQGRDGLKLSDHWSERPSAYLGAAAAGFPNLFFVLGPNTALGHNSILLMAEAQAEHVVRVLATMRDRQIDVVEPKPERQKAHDDMVQGRLAKTVWQTGGCTSWYKDADGRNPIIWPGTVREFRRLTEQSGLQDYRTVPRLGPRPGADAA